ASEQPSPSARKCLPQLLFVKGPGMEKHPIRCAPLNKLAQAQVVLSRTSISSLMIFLVVMARRGPKNKANPRDRVAGLQSLIPPPGQLLAIAALMAGLSHAARAQAPAPAAPPPGTPSAVQPLEVSPSESPALRVAPRFSEESEIPASLPRIP